YQLPRCQLPRCRLQNENSQEASETSWELEVGDWKLRYLPARLLTPAPAATAAARLLRPRFIDRQRSPAKALLVKLRNRVLRVLIGGHLDKRETSRPAGFAVPHDVHGCHVAGLCEQGR